MTMSNQIRILKADDVARHAVVTLPATSERGSPAARPVSAPPSDTAAAPDLEILMEQARAEGAADAAGVLEPSLRQLASALTGLADESAAARYAAMRADSDAVIGLE